MALADYLKSQSLSLFDGPNDNARAGRCNSLAARARNAARQIAKGKNNAAKALLTSILERVDGNAQQKDWMVPSAARDVVASGAEAIIALL